VRQENSAPRPKAEDSLAWLDLGSTEGLRATVTVLPGMGSSACAPSDPSVTLDPELEETTDPNVTRDVEQASDGPAETVLLPNPDSLGDSGKSIQIGRYEVLAKLGEGGMGAVYLAKESYLRRRVAIKQIKGNDAPQISRFVTEAQITAQLDHPGIIPIYALEIAEDGAVAYTMKPVAGDTLAERIERAQEHYKKVGHRDAELSAQLDDLLEAFVRVCEALHFAHSHGVIHRDLKPENIMIGAHREVHVMDWGLAKVIGTGEEANDTVDLKELAHLPAVGKTRAGAIKGTPVYMAPEQAEGRPNELTRTADIYGLGMILYEVVYLQRARRGDNLLQAIQAGRKNVLQPAPEALDDCPELAAIVHWATQTAPEERYPTAQALGDDVRRVLLGDETSALPDRGWRRLRRWVSHHPALAVGVATFALALAALAFVWQVQSQHAKEVEAEIVAERHRRAVGELVTRVGLRTRALVLHFQRLGGVTTGLAARTTGLLAGGQPGGEHPPLLRHQDFLDTKTAPAGSVKSSGYGGRLVNPRRAIGFAQTPQGQADLQLLSALVGELRAGFTQGEVRLSEAARLDARILGHEAPLEWTYVALDRSGAIVLFPASTSTWGPEYDPRQRQWYRDALAAYRKHGRGRGWSRPYLDLMGQGVVLTSTQVILDDSGEILGVAAADLTFESVIRSLLTFSDLPGFERAMLLDSSGNQLFATDHEVPIGADGVVTSVPHPDAAVVTSVREGRSSLLQREREGRSKLLVWNVISELGWAIVVEVDQDQLAEGLQLQEP
jgi:eukaryotic-like serine/threonine-protein kinase